MKKRILIPTITAIITISLFSSTTTYAGDKEWATAGKILTGIVAANVIGDLFVSERYVQVKQPGYKRRGYNKCRPKKRYYKNDYYSADISWRSSDGYPRRSGPKKRYKNAWKCADPIIVHIEKGRRIYQRRVKGATAYLQVYSDVCNEWVNIKEYPSIW